MPCADKERRCNHVEKLQEEQMDSLSQALASFLFWQLWSFCLSSLNLLGSICNLPCLFVCQVMFLVWFPWKTRLFYHGPYSNLNAADSMALSDRGTEFPNIIRFIWISQHFWGEQICPVTPTVGSSSVSPLTGTQDPKECTCCCCGKEPATNGREADLCSSRDCLKWVLQIL